MREWLVRKKFSAIVVFLIVLFPLFVFALRAAGHNGENYSADSLEQKAASEGSVKVIIKLLVPQIDELTSESNKFCSPEPGQAASGAGLKPTWPCPIPIAYAAQGVLLGIEREPRTR